MQRTHSATPHARGAAVAALLLTSALMSGCALTNKLFHNDAAEASAAALLQLQLNVMRYADEYTARISEPLVQFQNSTTDANERLAAQNWKVSQATAAYTIASGPNPAVNAIDMVVFTTLSRMTLDDTWVKALYGTRADPVRDATARMETMAWTRVREVISPPQAEELKHLIDDWRLQNPNTRAVAYIHLTDFATSLGQPKPGSPIKPGSLFSFLGLDPLSNLDPAVRELAQARQLAERALYFAERTPSLVDMQVERTALQFAVMPETVAVLRNLDRGAVAAQQAGDLAENLPTILATERAAIIEQLNETLAAREGELRGLLAEARSTLEAGTATSDSLKVTIASFDQLMKRFDKPDTATASTGRPFDITEYTETARELGETARQLDALLKQVDTNAPALASAAEQTSQHVRSLVDYAFWRLLELGLLLVAATVLGALGYRLVTRRWSRSPK